MKRSAMPLFVTCIIFTIQFNFALAEESCYELGYRFGLCATKSMHGIPCKPENDIVIPQRCRNNKETDRGIKAGAKAVYDNQNLDKKTSSSSSSINMLTTSLEALRERLKGKTKSEVKRLVGSPSRIENLGGKTCWIYGNTYSSEDRGIVFDGEKVLTVRQLIDFVNHGHSRFTNFYFIQLQLKDSIPTGLL